jgi:hypothetical protein
VVLISDFVSLNDSCLKTLRLLGHYFDCHAVHIVDASEQQLPAVTPLILQWAQQRLSVSSSSSQHNYQHALQQDLQQTRQLFYRARCHYTLLRSDHTLDDLRP